MGALFSYIESMVGTWRSKPHRVLILGLDYAGKSTLLYRLQPGAVETKIPSIGFNIETLLYKNYEFWAWDLCGTKHRPLWPLYLKDCDAIIYMLDAADPSRIDDAVYELHQLLEREELRDTTVLVFANKQDHPDCMKIEELRKRFDLSAVTKNPWSLQTTNAVTSEGVHQGLDWLNKAIT